MQDQKLPKGVVEYVGCDARDGSDLKQVLAIGLTTVSSQVFSTYKELCTITMANGTCLTSLVKNNETEMKIRIHLMTMRWFSSSMRTIDWDVLFTELVSHVHGGGAAQWTRIPWEVDCKDAIDIYILSCPRLIDDEEQKRLGYVCMPIHYADDIPAESESKLARAMHSKLTLKIAWHPLLSKHMTAGGASDELMFAFSPELRAASGEGERDQKRGKAQRGKRSGVRGGAPPKKEARVKMYLATPMESATTTTTTSSSSSSSSGMQVDK